MDFLDKIRIPKKSNYIKRQVVVTIGVLLNTALSYGMFYIDISSWLNFMMLLFGIFVLRKSMKETIGMIVIAIAFAIIIEMVIPFSIW